MNLVHRLLNTSVSRWCTCRESFSVANTKDGKVYWSLLAPPLANAPRSRESICTVTSVSLLDTRCGTLATRYCSSLNLAWATAVETSTAAPLFPSLSCSRGFITAINCSTCCTCYKEKHPRVKHRSEIEIESDTQPWRVGFYWDCSRQT